MWFSLFFTTQPYSHKANKWSSQKSILGFLIIGSLPHLHTASLSLKLRFHAVTWSNLIRNTPK